MKIKWLIFSAILFFSTVGYADSYDDQVAIREAAKQLHNYDSARMQEAQGKYNQSSYRSSSSSDDKIAGLICLFAIGTMCYFAFIHPRLKEQDTRENLQPR